MENQREMQGLEGKGNSYENGHIPRMLAKFLDPKFNNQEEMENIQGQAMPYTRVLRGEGKMICLEMTMVALEGCYPNLQTS